MLFFRGPQLFEPHGPGEKILLEAEIQEALNPLNPAVARRICHPGPLEMFQKRARYASRRRSQVEISHCLDKIAQRVSIMPDSLGVTELAFLIKPFLNGLFQLSLGADYDCTLKDLNLLLVKLLKDCALFTLRPASPALRGWHPCQIIT
jgi:hypothetical protein